MLSYCMPTTITEHCRNGTYQIQSNFTACGQANRNCFSTVHKPLIWLDYRFSDKWVGCTTIEHCNSTVRLQAWSITTETTCHRQLAWALTLLTKPNWYLKWWEIGYIMVGRSHMGLGFTIGMQFLLHIRLVSFRGKITVLDEIYLKFI